MVTNTKDNLQAHRFMHRRVRAALLDGDADSGERPLSRLGTGTLAGMFLTVALLAVAGIVGILRPGGSTAWQEPGAFIVDSETGARYVSLEGRLHSVLNYSSARLLLGDQLHVVSVSAGSLESAPHGPPVGITSAPDSLPDAAHMSGSTWSVCAVGDAADGRPFRTMIFPGRSTDGDAVPTEQGYLLRTTDGRTYLVAQGHSFPIDNRWLAALGYQGAGAIPVANDFVAALPPGEPIAPLTVPGIGEQGPPLPGTADPVAIGTVFVDRFDAHYLMTGGGLMTLTPLQTDLLLADPRLVSAYSGNAPAAVPISQAQVTQVGPPPLSGFGAGAQPPATAPTPVALPAGGQQLCVRYPAEGLPDIVVTGSDPSTLTAGGTVQLPAGGTVQFPADGGALVAIRSDPGEPAAGAAATTPRATSATAGPTASPGSTTAAASPASTASPGSTTAAASAGPTASLGSDSPVHGADTTGIPPDPSPNTARASANAPDVRSSAPDASPGNPSAGSPDASTSGPGGSASKADTGANPLICLVTATGIRYPLSGPRALQQLGFSGVSVAQLPAAVIGLLPVGPVLDPVAAAAAATP